MIILMIIIFMVMILIIIIFYNFYNYNCLVEEAKKEKPKQLLKQYSRISVIDGGFNFPSECLS